LGFPSSKRAKTSPDLQYYSPNSPKPCPKHQQTANSKQQTANRIALNLAIPADRNGDLVVVIATGIPLTCLFATSLYRCGIFRGDQSHPSSISSKLSAGRRCVDGRRWLLRPGDAFASPDEPVEDGLLL
jgi:hypothetical protein